MSMCLPKLGSWRYNTTNYFSSLTQLLQRMGMEQQRCGSSTSLLISLAMINTRKGLLARHVNKKRYVELRMVKANEWSLRLYLLSVWMKIQGHHFFRKHFVAWSNEDRLSTVVVVITDDTATNIQLAIALTWVIDCYQWFMSEGTRNFPGRCSQISKGRCDFRTKSKGDKEFEITIPSSNWMKIGTPMPIPWRW